MQVDTVTFKLFQLKLEIITIQLSILHGFFYKRWKQNQTEQVNL